MPEFGNPFSVKKSDRKLTHNELVRSIRMMIAAEYEAVQLYQEIAESTDNVLAQKVLIDIADEEKVHAGEFLRLLHELDPNEQKFMTKVRRSRGRILSGGGGGESTGSGDLGIGSLRDKGE